MTDSENTRIEYQRKIKALYATKSIKRKMSKIKIAIGGENSTKLLGIDLSKINCFVNDGSSLELWMDGAGDPLYIPRSEVESQAFDQLLDALGDEFSEMYGDEFPRNSPPIVNDPYDDDCPY